MQYCLATRLQPISRRMDAETRCSVPSDLWLRSQQIIGQTLAAARPRALDDLALVHVMKKSSAGQGLQGPTNTTSLYISAAALCTTSFVRDSTDSNWQAKANKR